MYTKSLRGFIPAVVILLGLTVGVFEAPAVAAAATVQVYPTTTTSHGSANLEWYNVTVCVTAAGSIQCNTPNVPITIPDGSDYTVSVKPLPVPGYSYTIKDGCAGVAQGDLTCYVDFQDGAPVTPPVVYTVTPVTTQTTTTTAQPWHAIPVTPWVAPTTTPQTAPVTTAATQTTVTHSRLKQGQIDAIIALLRAFGVGEATISNVKAQL